MPAWRVLPRLADVVNVIGDIAGAPRAGWIAFPPDPARREHPASEHRSNQLRLGDQGLWAVVAELPMMRHSARQLEWLARSDVNNWSIASQSSSQRE